MAVKADKYLPQDKRNANFGQHPQADTMELQVIRKGAKQFDQDKDRKYVDNQLAVDAINDSDRKVIGDTPLRKAFAAAKKSSIRPTTAPISVSSMTKINAVTMTSSILP